MKAVVPLIFFMLVALSGCVQQNPCKLSLCDCKCHYGATEDEGKLCGINCLAEFGVSGCEFRNGQCVEVYDIKSQAEQKCLQLCASVRGTLDLSDGPCLSDTHEWNISDWVCDVAHSPRQDVDNVPENQCQSYRSGLAKHFVEVSPDCVLIRSV